MLVRFSAHHLHDFDSRPARDRPGHERIAVPIFGRDEVLGYRPLGEIERARAARAQRPVEVLDVLDLKPDLKQGAFAAALQLFDARSLDRLDDLEKRRPCPCRGAASPT